MLWAAAFVALTAAAASQHATNRVHAWPSWRRLSGGASGGGWFAGSVELLAVAPLLLLPSLCPSNLHYVVSGEGREGVRQSLPLCRAPGLCMPRPSTPQARELRPGGAGAMRCTAAAAVALSAGVAALVGVCACLLFGGSVQVR